MYAITPELMRKIDAEQAKLQVNGEKTLMYNAGLCAVQAIEARVKCGNAVILCGAGNNGGDGYVIAEELALQGRRVTVANYLPDKKRTDAAKYFFARAKRAGCRIIDIESPLLADAIKGAAVIVDAVFGTGFHGALPKELEYPFSLCAQSSALKVAIDCPSGIDPTTAAVESTAFCADLTVCMSYPMRAVYLLPARAYCGKIEICDIGMDYDAIEAEHGVSDTVCDCDTVRRVFKRRSVDSHKGSYGSLLLVCGSDAMPGAARLALSGALRMGVGLCQLAAPRSVIACCAAAFPEAIYTEIPDSKSWTDEDVSLLVSLAKKSSAVLCGCGLGNVEGTKKLATAFISEEGVNAVLDADALNALSESSWEKATGNIVITPHPKEFSRLSGNAISDIATNRYELAKAFASEKNVTLLLKGADTVTAAPDGRLCFNPSGNAGLAKGGSGDVLAGICAGILTWSKNAFDAASCAAYLHGLAGDELKKKYSEYGYLTGELAEAAATALASVIEREKSY